MTSCSPAPAQAQSAPVPHYGDALAYLATLPPASVDLVLTSPPYPGCPMWTPEFAELHSLCTRVVTACCHVLKPGGMLALNWGDVPTSPVNTNGLLSLRSAIETGLSLYRSQLQDSDLNMVLRTEIVWDKYITNPMPPPVFMRRPCITHLTHEYIYVWVKGAWHPRERTIALSPEEKSWLARSVWSIHGTKGPVRRLTTPFPYELADRIIRLFSLPGDTVLDPFAGIGTTLKAAALNDRTPLGCEANPACVEFARAWMSTPTKEFPRDAIARIPPAQPRPS